MVIVAFYFFLMSLANHYEMWRFTHGPEIFDGPLVSVLIPMRNEERNAEACLNSLENQLYKNYEILVLNDNSTDKTAAILERIASGNQKVKVFNGMPLPDDWYGKPFALHQLSIHAKGEILLLTDADTIHTPASISWAVTNMKYLKADMISGYIGQKFMTLGEIITIPLMFYFTGFVIPLFLNRFIKSTKFSAAIGQYIAIKNDVFKAIGGCQPFKKKTSEDIYMSRYVKKMGYSTRFLNITEYASCRMYEGYRASIEGIGKNVFDFLGKNTLVIFLLAIGVFFFLFFPFPLLIGCVITGSQWTFHILIVNILYTLTWLFMFLGLRLNWWYSLFWPLTFLNLIYLAWYSWFRTVSGKGFIWKDRKVS
jgi:chlorobactene glucosyltransferase